MHKETDASAAMYFARNSIGQQYILGTFIAFYFIDQFKLPSASPNIGWITKCKSEHRLDYQIMVRARDPLTPKFKSELQPRDMNGSHATAYRIPHKWTKKKEK